jgi:Fur family ferric uptake transcriptional regulator
MLLAALDAAGGFASAQGLHAALLDGGSRIGLTTVYRRLHELERDGLVDVARDERGERLHRLRTDRDHCHYLFCRACGRSVPVESGPVERWAATVGPAAGFRDVDHVVELRGVCERCSDAGTSAASRSVADTRSDALAGKGGTA